MVLTIPLSQNCKWHVCYKLHALLLGCVHILAEKDQLTQQPLLKLCLSITLNCVFAFAL